MKPTKTDWQIRLYIYAVFIERGRPPTAPAIAARFSLSAAAVAQSLQHLDAAHALVLRDGEILMAHPLSAVRTDYRCQVNGRWLYANCAWDSLGIPAMLDADAQIEARHPLSREVMRYAIVDGQLQSAGDELVHFAQPFRHWYADIVDT